MFKSVKRVITIVLTFVFVLTGVNVSMAEDTTDQVAQNKSSRVLVAYFSRAGDNYGVGVIEKGNTEIIAEMIATETGADLFKIESVDSYPEDYNDCTEVAKKEQAENARPKLKKMLKNLDDYDVIYIGVPVWWGDIPMPVYTFVESLDWNGKTVYPFTTHAGSRLGKVPETIKRECAGAIVKDALAISGYDAQNKRDVAKEQLLNWLKNK